MENNAPYVTSKQLNAIRLENNLSYEQFAQLLRLKGGKKAINQVKQWAFTREGCCVPLSWDVVNILIEKGYMKKPKTYSSIGHISAMK